MRCSVYCPERIDNLRADGWSCRCLLARQRIAVGQPTIYIGECVITDPEQQRTLRNHIQAVIACLEDMVKQLDAAGATREAV